MTRQELIAHCLTFEDAREDYPFSDRKNTILRHKNGGKWFAIVFEQDGRLCINVKCDPQKADFWRSVYKGVTPGWHMNKRHWNTIDVHTDVPAAELWEMIADSYALTC